MKKVISLLIVLALLFSAAINVYAVDDTDPRGCSVVKAGDIK